MDIEEGEQVTIQYISHLYGNVLRRAEIQQNWMFQCGWVELLWVAPD